MGSLIGSAMKAAAAIRSTLFAGECLSRRRQAVRRVDRLGTPGTGVILRRGSPRCENSNVLRCVEPPNAAPPQRS